jgi:hypothetical protein
MDVVADGGRLNREGVLEGGNCGGKFDFITPRDSLARRLDVGDDDARWPPSGRHEEWYGVKRRAS